MEQLAAKISGYHLVSYALTGAVLILSYGALHDFTVSDSIPIQLGIAYAIGLAVSRIGSLIFELFLKKIKVIKYASYEDYIVADNSDPKVSQLAEQSAFYRTLSTGYICIGFISIFDNMRPIKFDISNISETIIYFIASILFLFAYRKQNDFVYKRVLAVKSGKAGLK